MVAEKSVGEYRGIELEKAHTIQAAYVQKLQSSQGKIDAYKATITMQEKVIAKLEELMREIVKSNVPFEQSELDRPAAIKLMEDNHEDYKLETIKKIPEDQRCTP